MKTLAFFVLLLLAGCEREAPQPPDPLDLLPPATQTGENTLGFLLDGEPWMPNRIFHGDYRKSDGAFNLPCRRDSFDMEGEHAGEALLIQFKDSVWKPGSFELSDYPPNRGYFFSFASGCEYETHHSGRVGIVKFTQFDTIARIASGTFEFTVVSPDCLDTIAVTHGRFDVSF